MIAPFEQARTAIRTDHAAFGVPFLQVYVATPVDECARRDVKGLYAGQATGSVHQLTGVDDPYQPPPAADLVVDTTGQPVTESVRRVAALLQQRSLV